MDMLENQANIQAPNAHLSEALIAVCVGTFKRPQFFRDLLLSLRETRTEEGFRLHLIIVDNDPLGSAHEIVGDLEPTLPFPVSYIIEESRGHCSVRNRSIREAAALGTDYISFVDDDQLVEPDWLAALYRTAVDYSLDIVKSEIPPRYEPGVPQWAIECGYFQDIPRPTGKPTRRFGENGTLMRMSSVLQIAEGFDERFNLTGGGDGIFFARMHALGFRSGGCQESVVYERYPASRTTISWILMRSYRCGIVKGIATRTVNPARVRTVKWFAIALGYASLYGTLALARLPFGRKRWVTPLANVMLGLGVIKGLLQGNGAFSFREYEVTHGN